MKKIFKYLYIFSKFSTSFILLISILILGYFLLISYKDQEKTTKNQSDLLFSKLKKNSVDLDKVFKKLEVTDSILSENKKILEKDSGEKNLEDMNNLREQISELNIKLKEISLDLERVETLRIDSKESQQTIVNLKSINVEKNKNEIANLIILKFENNIDFDEELNILKILNDESKQPVFEKINLVKLKNYRGNLFLKNNFLKETNFFLKDKIKVSINNIIANSLMAFIKIEPSKKNIIKNNNINILKEINNLIEKKEYLKSFKKLSFINSHEIFFKESIKQLQIAIEFKKLIRRIG